MGCDIIQIMSEYDSIPSGPDQSGTSSLPVDPITALEAVSQRFRILDHEADSALHEMRDVEIYRERLESKGQLLIDLHSHLIQTNTHGIHVQKEILEESAYFADAAREALENKNYFALGVLLIDKGSKIGDKNNLEKLIDRVSPRT